LELEPLHIQGAYLITEQPFTDNRGTFMEAFNSERFALCGLPAMFPQDNLSTSVAGTLRGLHIQRNNPQGKLIRCLQGVIYDVLVDLRFDSPTFGKHLMVELSHHRKRALWAPPGTAHGFYSPTDSVVYYKCSTLYDQKTDGGINPFDPELRIAWPERHVIISKKDQALPIMRTWLENTHGQED
jgi:dTDP-4-dehydrorhamnose 3,5-epimerase